MDKQSSPQHKVTAQPQPIKGSVSIAGKNVAVGSITSSEGSTPKELIQGLRQAAKNEVFPQPQALSNEQW